MKHMSFILEAFRTNHTLQMRMQAGPPINHKMVDENCRIDIIIEFWVGLNITNAYTQLYIPEIADSESRDFSRKISSYIVVKVVHPLHHAVRKTSVVIVQWIRNDKAQESPKCKHMLCQNYRWVLFSMWTSMWTHAGWFVPDNKQYTRICCIMYTWCYHKKTPNKQRKYSWCSYIMFFIMLSHGPSYC